MRRRKEVCEAVLARAGRYRVVCEGASGKDGPVPPGDWPVLIRRWRRLVESAVRVISARRADKDEEREYWKRRR